MKALILAGGLGTRMRPLTFTRPKHLLPIANRPHIELVFDLLQKHGVDHVILLTSYLAEAFETTIERARARGMTLEVTHEAEPLGTAGGLKNAQHLVGDETFLALNGDVLTDLDLTAIIKWHRETGAEATIVLTPVEDPSAFGVVPTDPDGRVTGFIEKPPKEEAPTNEINAGVYVLEPRVLDRIPGGEVWSAERQLFPEVVADAGMFARATDAYWMDIGTPEKYLAANLDALTGRFAGGVVPDDQGSLIGRNVEQAETARVSSASVGDGTRIGADVMITRSVLLPGVEVGPGAEITDSVLGEGAVVGPGARLEKRYLGDRETVIA